MVMRNIHSFNDHMELRIDIMQKIKNYLWKDNDENGSILR